MTPQMQAMFKKSLKSNRWDHINLGPNGAYTHENMVARWVQEKNKWKNRQPVFDGEEAERDVRGAVTSGPIPGKTSGRHDLVRRTMKQLTGPYTEF